MSRLEQLLPEEKLLKKLTLDLFSPVAKKLGLDKRKNEAHTDTLLRSLAISRAGRAGDEKIIEEVKNKFLLIQKDRHVSPDIRGVVYSIIATYGDIKEFKVLIKKYKEENLHEEKNRIGNALGDFTNPKILEEVCSDDDLD